MTSLFHIWAPASLDTLVEPSQTLSNARQVSKLTIKYFFLCAGIQAGLDEILRNLSIPFPGRGGRLLMLCFAFQ